MYRKVQVGNDQEKVQSEKDSNSMWKSHVIVFFYDRQNLVHSSDPRTQCSPIPGLIGSLFLRKE